MSPQPAIDHEGRPTAAEARMLVTLSRFGTVWPISESDVERLESLGAAGYVARHSKNATYSLTARGSAFVRKTAGNGECVSRSLAGPFR